MKEKFIYNKHTLQYEKIETNWRESALKVFGLISTVVVSVLLVSPIWQRIFPTAAIQQKEKEIDQLTFKFKALEKTSDINGSALQSLQSRDAHLYRMMFNMNPIDAAVWNGGSGGHDRLLDLAKFPTTENILKTQDKVEKLSQQLVIQSRSLDTLVKMAADKEKMLSAIPSIKPVREDMLHAGLDALSGFGWRVHPIHHVRRFHKGIDFSASSGTAIQATGDGVVEIASVNGGYGNCVIVNHGFGYQTLYGHMMRIDVKAGQKIKKGERLGVVGSTGSSTGPHCHYEVHFNGNIVDPLPFCLDGLSPMEYAALVNAASREGRSLD